MWIFRTPRFNDDVATHHLEAVVASKCEFIERQLTRSQASMVGRPYAGFIRVRHGNFRIIGGVEHSADKDFFVWYEVLPRGGRDYNDFTSYSQSIQRVAGTPEVREWLNAKTAEEVSAAQPDPLPDGLLPWFDSLNLVYSTTQEEDVLVYETEGWVHDMVALTSEQPFWPTLLQLVSQLVDELAADSVASSDHPHARTSGGFVVHAQKIAHKRIFLLGAQRERPDAAVPTTVQLGDEALPRARRMYPHWVLADQVIWFSIQKGDAYNLSLSPEEHDLLVRISGQAAAGNELPVFINGQAGSGKSTMLAFAFAGLCKVRESRSAGGLPRFITVNESLLRKARETTQQILRGHFADDTRYDGIELEGLFSNLQSYLLELLPVDQRERFDPVRRVDYNDFAQAWAGGRSRLPPNPAPRRGRYSPELVWYVIRSLIKGSDTGGDLEPDDYSVELPRREQVVSTDVFSDIYTTFYKGWYLPALRDKDLWDDQDLTAAALESIESHGSRSEIAALAVDEAQDLTRRELRLLTRATIYSDYAIPHLGGPVHIPVILAGDPLQTLSPTGFRWDAVKAGIVEELEGLFGRQAPTPVLLSLQNNYRSVKEIVRLANTIQLWRAYLFGLADLQPQGAWNPSEGSHRIRHLDLDEVDIERLKEFAASTPMLVPCEEDGELDYVRGDALLTRMHPDASEKNPPGNVHSAASVKGLEFDKVILYKFGEAIPSLSWQPTPTGQRDLQAEYFFNKLYVAVTRAAREIYIADTAAGESLWANFNDDSVAKLLANAEERTYRHFTAKDTGTLSEARDPFELGEVEDKNPSDTARQFKESAQTKRNPRQMRRASYYFRLAGERVAADECEALALELEGAFLDAGLAFAQAKKVQQAWQCLWLAGAWHELDDLAAQHSSFPAAQAAAVTYMGTEARTAADLRVLAESIPQDDSAIAGDPQWETVVAQMCLEASLLGSETEPETRLAIARCLGHLFEGGFRTAGLRAAKLYLDCGNRLSARRILESTSIPPTPERARLAFELDGAPDGLRHLAASGLHHVVRDAWTEAGRPYGDDWMMHVLPCLADHGYVVDRIDYYLATARAADAAAAFHKHPKNEWKVAYDAVARRIIDAFGSSRQSSEGFDFIEDVSLLRLGRLSKNEMYLRLVQSLAEGFARDDETQTKRDVEPLRQVMAVLGDRERGIRYSDVPTDTVPAFGMLFEVVGDHRSARSMYKRFAESSDQALREYCRRRFLHQCTELLNSVRRDDRTRTEIQDEQHASSRRWGLDVDQRSHSRVSSLQADPESVEPRVAELATPSGTLGPVSWNYNRERAQLAVFFNDGKDLFLSARINLADGDHVDGGTRIVSTDDGVMVTAGDYHVSVGVGVDLRVAVRQGTTELGSQLIARLSADEEQHKSVKAPPTKRTAGTGRVGRGKRPPAFEPPLTALGGAGVKTFKLREELNISLNELQDVSEGLGYKRYRGDQNIPFIAAVAIRKHFQEHRQ